MHNMTKTLIAASVAAASSLASGVAMAELSANVGMSSNYMWRGWTQSGDEAAISGGLDYAHDSGLYVGTWTSSLGGGQYEQDAYVGFGGEVAGLGYDLGYIKYMYPIGDGEADFDEIYASLSYSYFTLGVAYVTDVEWDADDYNDKYYSLAFEYPVKEDLTFGALVGSVDFDDAAGDDYTHYQLSLTKSSDMGDFTFAYDKHNGDEDEWAGLVNNVNDARITVSYSKGFDL